MIVVQETLSSICIFFYYFPKLVGYSIFVIIGKVPESEADQVLRLMPAQQTQRPALLADQQGQRSSVGASTSSSNIVSLGDLQSALAANKSLIPGMCCFQIIMPQILESALILIH